MVYEQLEYPASKRTYSVEELKVEWAQEYTFYSYSDDMYIIRKDDAFGFYNISTDEIISGIDGAISPCSDGVFVVRMYDTAPEQGDYFLGKDSNEYTYGIIDTQSNEITPFMYASVSNELIIVSTDEETHGLIDMAGNEVLPCVYVSIDVSEEGAIQANYSDEDAYQSQSSDAEPIPCPDIFFYSNVL